MPEITIPAMLARNSTECGWLDVMVDGDRRISHALLDSASLELAARLVAAGVNKGDRVGLLMPNGIEWAINAMAIMRIGAVLVPLSTLLRPPELVAQLATAAVSHLVLVESYRNRSYLEDLESEIPGVLIGERSAALPYLRRVWTEIPSGSVPLDLVRALGERVSPADDMAILFTSGSRGTPKGVIHMHGNAIAATASGLSARCVGPGERLYIPMPFFWMGGFGGGLLTVLLAGATLLTEQDPEPASTLAFLEREKATLFRGWPDQAARLAADPAFVSADLSSMSPASLGAVLPVSLRPAPGARANLFGMTESFGPYCGYRADTDMPDGEWGSCGQSFEGVEVRITDPETGLPRSAGEEGEIWLRGHNMLRGICGRPRSTVFTADEFYRTGDLGRLDEAGFLWYVGRLDDMFKVKGATVYPSEVEAVLRSIKGVKEAHVTNVTGESGQEEVGAVVVSSLDVATLRDQVKSRLSAFKVPTVWLVTEDRGAVPMLASGKVDKTRLQEQLKSGACL